MTAAARQSRHALALVSREGEDVVLPGGTAQGVLWIPGTGAGPMVGSEVGLAMRPSDQVNPVLWLLEADAAAVAEGDTVTVRAVAYTVAHKARAEGGLTGLELMPAGASGAGEFARWR